MIRANVIELIGEAPAAHGVFDAPTETKRRVFCTIKSIGMQEAYQAMGIGLNPELKIVLDHDFEYHGEKLMEFNDTRYRIIRTYVTDKDSIELTVQRVEGNAAEVSS